MAKLYEEVINGSVPSPSADLLIHFTCPSDGLLLGSPALSPPCSVAPVNASAGSGCLVAQNAGSSASSGRTHDPQAHESAPASPRVGGSAIVRSGSAAGSPPRFASQSLNNDLTPSHAHHAPLRCHTLVLRSQPHLLNCLLSSRGFREASDVEARQAPQEGGSVRGDDGADSQETLTEIPMELGSSASSCGGGLANQPSSRSSRSPTLRFSPPERPAEVVVDDEPDIFLEMIKFVYLHTCHVDHSNVKSLMLVADRYGVEDIVVHCLQWMQEHFTATIFYHFLTFKLTNSRFRQLLRQSLLHAVRSRRCFSLVTEDSQWEKLPVSFVEAMLSSDELPVVSELEVLQLLARWAAGSLNEKEKRLEAARKKRCQAYSSMSSGDELSGQSVLCPHSQGDSSDGDVLEGRTLSCGTAASSAAGVAMQGADVDMEVATDVGRAPATAADKKPTTAKPNFQNQVSPQGEEPCEGCSSSVRGTQEDMLQLLRTFRKSDMAINLKDLEPILELLQLNCLFSTRPPRETSALDPGFMIYRGVAGVNVPAPLGELNQTNVVQETWRGSSVSLGSRDFLQQQEGFKPRNFPDDGIMTFPRLWVRIKCSSWSHREKRTLKNTTSHSRMSGPLGGDVTPPISESVPSPWSLPPVTEALTPQTLRGQSQDDTDIGRNRGRSLPSVPNITDNEKIEHKVVCAVISGHMRHGIRIGQRERCSLYDLEDLYGQCGEVCLGGSPTEVEFELQLTVGAPNHCGICRCALAVLPSGASESPLDPLLEIVFDASAEEHVHFYISSSHFDSNSTYSVALNWVLGPGSGRAVRPGQ